MPFSNLSLSSNKHEQRPSGYRKFPSLLYIHDQPHKKAALLGLNV
ncbi:hypothetical protein HMPREF0322_01950 [Desulfitobacterium hafniense DP7]|uniref:Uncharacterized protein n=1 Tax=Desulfitobacterium hafniense DP7 TaxID=537010 RepID=G9XLW4_DESHA|nr:hypothetical protein HMPREF0322_01950 [Desulfitobacterium hafniense DP7]